MYLTSLSLMEFNNYHLYPHGFDDLVFIVYQPEKSRLEGRRGTIAPLLQWLVFVFIASLIVYALRHIAKRRPVSGTATDAVNNYINSFVDSVAVFLGIALHAFGNSRAERWFLISFSIFALIFKIVYTDNLFVMFAATTQNRINSIDQLLEANVRIAVDYTVTDEFYLRSRM